MEWYRTATELYNGSLRGIEQRSSSFLTAHSFLAAAFAIMFVEFAKNSPELFLPLLGLAIVGLVWSVMFMLSHRSAAEEAAYWRAYMRSLEDKIKPDDILTNKGPWQSLYTAGHEHHWFGNIGKLAEKLPYPLLWLATPTLFATAWLCALLWLFQVKVYGTATVCAFFWVVLAIVLAVSLAWVMYNWANAKYSIPDELVNRPNQAVQAEAKTNKEAELTAQDKRKQEEPATKDNVTKDAEAGQKTGKPDNEKP